MFEKVYLIVLDSVGIGELPDANEYGDVGSNTLKSCYDSGKLNVPNLQKLGLFNIDGINYGKKVEKHESALARMSEKSKGKDTTIGHWEISGIVSEKPLPTYPNGFPSEVIKAFEEKTGRKVLCNLPYSGTKVLEDYGKKHVQSGDLIVYTSADSVFQIASHEDVVSVEKLYEYCEIARELLKGEHGVGRVIARPFEGEYPNYKRTTNRHDYSLTPPSKTILNELCENDILTYGVGKINDIFAGEGIVKTVRIKSNADGMSKTQEIAKSDFKGLCFVNLVDFDMLFGHRNDILGYTNALNEFDEDLGKLMQNIGKNDAVIITADHGCDPGTSSTDHSREYVPMIAFGEKIASKNLKTRESFADIGATVAEMLGVKTKTCGESFLSEILK